MSKFERYDKKTESYIYPHKHCKKCGKMIKESYTFCPECYKVLQEEKKKKRLFNKIKSIFTRKKKED